MSLLVFAWLPDSATSLPGAQSGSTHSTDAPLYSELGSKRYTGRADLNFFFF